MKKRTFSLASIITVSLALLLAAIVVFVRGGQTGMDRKPEPGKDAIAKSLNIDPGELQSLSTMYRAITLVQQHYLDASRIVPRKMLLEAMKELELDIPMLIARVKDDTLDVKVGKNQKRFDLKDLQNTWLLLSRFKDIFGFIKANITDDSVDFTELQYVALNGMLKALDPHTVLLTPDIYRSMKDRTHGNFGGLGIVISIRDGNLTIISPIDGTPAERAGLLAGDIITKIDEASTINMPINDAVDLMRGKPGTSVTLQIQRKTWSEEKSFRIRRAIIKVRSIDSASMPGSVGYIRIHDFQANTATDLREHLQNLSKKGKLKGLILDLRSNPGGLLSAAIDVADVFLKDGVIVTTAGQQLSARKVEKAQNNGDEPDYPIVVLVNSGTASASEIVAGALKGHNRAVIIGERTFGKGSVQVLNEFPDNSALKLTTAQYLTPGDISIQSVGIPPHIELMKVRADEQAIHLRKSIRYREGDLSRHFENANGQKADRPSVVLKYLYTPELKKEEPAEEGEENESLEEDQEDITEQSTYNFKFEPDFEINLGRDIALKMHEKGEQGFDEKTLGSVFDRLDKQENTRLVSALRKLGIDWSEGKAEASRIESTITIIHPDKLHAGDENELSVTVKNIGENAIYQLLAVTRSDFAPLNHKELAFGKIPPGQTITRTLKIKIPQNYPSRTDDVKVSFDDANDHSYAPLAYRFTTEELPAPVFAFSTVFMDDIRGNSDGLLQPGEIIRLIATIKNSGEGMAMSVFTSLSNESGHNIFLKKGRKELEEMAPGETKQAEFEFEVKKAFDRKAVNLKLSVMDVKLRVYTTQALRYAILPALATEPAAGNVKATRDTTVWSAPMDAPSVRPLSRIDQNTVLKVLGKASDWYRVALNEELWGWLKVSECAAADGSVTPNLTVNVNEPPEINIQLPSKVLRSATLKLSGTASDAQLVKDLYIFNNQDKVFFALNEGKSLSFNADIPLEPGINYITVVAEETADLETRQTLVVRRDQENGMPYMSSDTIEGTPESLGVVPINQTSN